jgi:hypothetical protein
MAAKPVHMKREHAGPVEQRGKKYRLIEPGGQIAETPQGNPWDGGGHRTAQGRAASQSHQLESEKAAAVMTIRELIDRLKQLLECQPKSE